MKYGMRWAGVLLLLALAVPAGAQNEVVKTRLTNKEYHAVYTPSFSIDGAHKPVRNVILMIGDGMGLAHASAGMFMNQGALTLTNLKTIGLVRTQSASHFTTDSAASGTAYATGKKTRNGAIGVDKEGKVLENITEKLSEKGFATGVLTTDNMDGATPASFYAHQPERGMSDEIWSDLPDCKLTFFGGGSRELMEKKGVEKRLEKAGFTLVESVADRNAATAARLGVLPPAAKTASVNENRGDFLPVTTAFALDYLSKRSDKGFFLMVEGARIDKSAHNNDFKGVVGEVLDFDQAVEAAIRFAEKDGHTLVIISADHETGALSLGNGHIADGKLTGNFSTKGHTSIMVPLYAYGPWSDLFTGVQENSDVSNKIYELLTKGK